MPPCIAQLYYSRTWKTRVAGWICFPFRFDFPRDAGAGPTAATSSFVVVIGAASRATQILMMHCRQRHRSASCIDIPSFALCFTPSLKRKNDRNATRHSSSSANTQGTTACQKAALLPHQQILRTDSQTAARTFPLHSPGRSRPAPSRTTC